MELVVLVQLDGIIGADRDDEAHFLGFDAGEVQNFSVRVLVQGLHQFPVEAVEDTNLAAGVSNYETLLVQVQAEGSDFRPVRYEAFADHVLDTAVKGVPDLDSVQYRGVELLRLGHELAGERRLVVGETRVGVLVVLEEKHLAAGDEEALVVPDGEHVAEVEFELLEVLLDVDGLHALERADVPHLHQPVRVRGDQLRRVVNREHAHDGRVVRLHLEHWVVDVRIPNIDVMVKTC